MALISEVAESIYEIKPEGKDLEEIANSLADVLVKGSKLTREGFLASSPYFIPATIEGYRQYFKKKMI